MRVSKILPLLTLATLGWVTHLYAQKASAHTVTAVEYCDFLNHVADPDLLYDEKMGVDSRVACITRAGIPGQWHYEAIAGRENFPVPYLNEARAGAYCAAMNLYQESNYEDFFLGSNQNSFSIAINSDASELSLQIPNLLSDSNYLQKGCTIGGITAVIMIVMGMVEEGAIINEGGMDNVRPATGNTPTTLTEIKRRPSPAQPHSNERTTRNFQGMSVTEARGLTGEECASDLGDLRQRERDARENRERAISPSDDVKPASATEEKSASISLKGIPLAFINRSLGVEAKSSIENNKARLKAFENDSPLDPDTLQYLSSKIAIEQKKIFYNGQIASKLYFEGSNSDDDRLRALKNSWAIHMADHIATSGTKMDHLAHQLQQDYQQLTDDKNRLAALQTEVVAQNVIDPELSQAINHLNESITMRRSLMEERVSYAELLCSPNETITPETKTEIERKKWDCIALSAESQSSSLLARREIAGYEGKYSKELYLSKTGRSFLSLAQEAQKAVPNQQAIDLLTRSTGFSQQVVSALEEGKTYNAEYFRTVVNSFNSAVEEAQKPAPHQQVIDLYTRSADFYQQAASASEVEKIEKAEYFSNAASSLNHASLEARKYQPNQEAIDVFIRITNLFKEAASALEKGEIEKARYINIETSDFIRKLLMRGQT